MTDRIAKSKNSDTRNTDRPGLKINLKLQRKGFTLDVDLALPDRGITVITGPSGSGKTTLLRCIAGLEKAQGSIHFNDTTWQDNKTFLPTYKRKTAYVFQEASLFPHMSVKKNLEFAVERSQSRMAARKLREIVKLLDIDHVFLGEPHELSGGERQRVAIARALLNMPDVLLMDEPMAAIDEQRKQEILSYLELVKEYVYFPIIYVTHSLNEAARLADTIVVIEKGTVRAQAPVEEAFSDPDFPLPFANQLGVAFDVTIDHFSRKWALSLVRWSNDCAIWLNAGRHRPGESVRVRILARDISLTRIKIPDSSIQNTINCTIKRIRKDSDIAMAIVTLDAGGKTLLARITRRSVDQLNLVEGEAIWAQIKSASLA